MSYKIAKGVIQNDFTVDVLDGLTLINKINGKPVQ